MRVKVSPKPIRLQTRSEVELDAAETSFAQMMTLKMFSLEAFTTTHAQAVEEEVLESLHPHNGGRPGMGDCSKALNTETFQNVRVMITMEKQN